MPRYSLDDLDLSIGKRTRLHRLLYDHGPGNGTMLLLPVDQGLEHGPRDFAVNPPAADPAFQVRLAKEAGFSGIVFHVGLAEKYMKEYAGEVPLVLKINGKTDIPPDDEAFSGLTGSVEDAVRLGADAVGYTLYVGSPRQDEDFRQLEQVRRACERYGMPLIVWAYPRGRYVEQKGGRDSLYAVDYAARVAAELGADVIKVNVPVIDEAKMKLSPSPYNELRLSTLEAIAKVVESAGRSLVIISGGGKISDEQLLEKARLAMEAGATGLIFGRNIWQRPWDEALKITQRIREIMLQYPAPGHVEKPPALAR
jgi:class I fructose-bisphosphate aldolase